MIVDEVSARNWLADQPGCDALAFERLNALISLLVEENQQQNLVSAASMAEVWRRHIADSAQLIGLLSGEPAGPWLDLGTGAGFPGLVVAILRPQLEVILLESRARRIDWLSRARQSLGLGRVAVAGTRLQKLDSRPFAVISARAFAPLPDLLSLSARFSTEATEWLLPKGRSAGQELAELTGWRHMFHVKHSLTDPDACIITGRLTGRIIGKGRRKP